MRYTALFAALTFFASLAQAQNHHMTILGNGNVGIGIDLPQHRFHVIDDSSSWRFWHTENGNPQFRIVAPSGANSAWTMYDAIADEPTAEFGFPVTEGPNRNFNFRIGGEDLFTIRGTGKLGINNIAPESMLHISDGDVQITGGDIYVENSNTGIIMKSSNGQCWRVRVSNTGELSTSSTGCPN